MNRFFKREGKMSELIEIFLESKKKASWKEQNKIKNNFGFSIKQIFF